MTDDFGNLPFDVERHREGIAKMSRMGMDPAAIRAGLIARERVVFGSPGARFRIRAAGDSPAGQTGAGADSVDSEVLYRSTDPREVARVRNEVEGYFLRHFPGRTDAEVGDGESGGLVMIQWYA